MKLKPKQAFLNVKEDDRDAIPAQHQKWYYIYGVTLPVTITWRACLLSHKLLFQRTHHFYPK